MTEQPRHSGAVFLSYASEDADAAARICESLRAAGVEVWLDKSELRGGDAWDAQIKKQIHDCALFVPLISAHTNARTEGYFRREWKQATRRLQDRADDAAFLVPVVVDDTREADARVPEEFFQAHWTWLPGGETPPEFAQRIRQLLGMDPARESTANPRAKIEPSARNPGYRQSRNASRVWSIGLPVVALLLVLGGGAVWYIEGTSDAPAAKLAATTVSPITAVAPDDKSIAVLPFVNMSPDKDQDYFADGISEELLNLLTQVPELRVIARTSSFSFKDKDVDIAEIARKLNVANVLEGSVRKSSDTVRITAQLVRASDSSHLWSQTYDRRMTNVFEVQDQIAAAVVSELKMHLLNAAPKTEITDPKAYALFLQAREMGRQFTKVGFERSNDFYRQALDLDPGYAAAWEGLAGNYCNQAVNGLTPVDQSIRLAREATNKALALEPAYSRAFFRLGWIALNYDLDLSAAAQHFKDALALESANPDFLAEVGYMVRRLGRLEQAIAIGRYQVGLDPINPYGHEALAYSYRYAGRLDDAIAALRKVLELSPGYMAGHEGIGEVLLQKGDARSALAEMRQEVLPGLRLVGLSMAYHALGQEIESDAALAEVIEKYADVYALNIAYVFAFRGQADQAFEWLDKAARNHDLYFGAASGHPMFSKIHSDPRWLPFLRKFGMTPQQLAAIKFEVKLPQ
jgi:TolB-like protein/Flp pilus assembly protein TadD